jgi:hypothetical protein
VAQHRGGALDEVGHVDLADRRPRAHAAEEGELVGPEVAEAGERPLVEQRGHQRRGRRGEQAADRLLGVPVVTERRSIESGSVSSVPAGSRSVREERSAPVAVVAVRVIGRP